MKDFLDTPARQLFEKAAKWPDLRIYQLKAAGQSKAFVRGPWLGNFRSMVEKAHYIEITRDLVWTAVELAWLAPPDVLLDAMAAYRNPYEQVVFEFPWAEKAKAQAQLGITTQEAPEGEGRAFVAVHQHPDTGVLAMTPFCAESEDNKMAQMPLTVRWGVSAGRDAGSDGFAHLLKSIPCTIPDVKAHYLMSSAYLAKHEGLAQRLLADPRIFVQLSGPTAHGALQKMYTGESRADRQAALWRGLISDTAGDFRFLCALFAIINRPTSLRFSQWAPAVGSKPYAPSDREHVATLLLPRERLVNLLTRPRRPRTEPLAEHDVQGHWAYSHQRGDESCDHVWPAVFARRQFCTKCDKLRWWKPSFQRGTGERKSHGDKIYDYQGAGHR